MRSLVNKAFDQINETGNLQLFKSANPDYADGEFGRDFVYVKDAVDMTLYFLENKTGGLFNVGSGQYEHVERSRIRDFSALGREAEIEFIEICPTTFGTISVPHASRPHPHPRGGLQGGTTPLEKRSPTMSELI